MPRKLHAIKDHWMQSALPVTSLRLTVRQTGWMKPRETRLANRRIVRDRSNSLVDSCCKMYREQNREVSKTAARWTFCICYGEIQRHVFVRMYAVTIIHEIIVNYFKDEFNNLFSIFFLLNNINWLKRYILILNINFLIRYIFYMANIFFIK